MNSTGWSDNLLAWLQSPFYQTYHQQIQINGYKKMVRIYGSDYPYHLTLPEIWKAYENISGRPDEKERFIAALMILSDNVLLASALSEWHYYTSVVADQTSHCICSQ